MKKNMHPIAIVGVGGLFPGAEDIDRFSDNIMNRVESVRTVPAHRWSAPAGVMVSRKGSPDHAASTIAGIVDDFQFNPHGFKLPPDLLSGLDPLHSMVLHAGRDAVEGLSITDDLRNRTGVVLAAIALPTQKSSELSWRILVDTSRRPLSKKEALAASVVGTPAGLLARAMAFAGGSFTLDAACASSLYAIKIACDLLNNGRNDMMIAGGVSRPDSLYTQVGFTQLQALSPTGRCSPFDRNADGLVVGEGAGILALKRLPDAIRAGDTIWGVIRGAGWSNDIAGNLVAPASEGQIRAMAQAFDTAGWQPSDVQHVECHGSGTPVGDAVELTSLVTLWRDRHCSNARCAIGSVKSNLGHLLTAAGSAGVIKTLVALKTKRLPPSINFSKASDKSPLHDSPFHVQTRAEFWEPAPLATNPSRRTRRAGVSAFGFGGINAHLLIEEYRSENRIHAVPADPERTRDVTPRPVAVVGMETFTAVSGNLIDFYKTVLSGTPPEPDSPGERWRLRIDRILEKELKVPQDGYWLRSVDTRPGEFHIPPNQFQDLLPQHLVMLKTAMGALRDAGIPHRPGATDPQRIRFGGAIGIDFDFEATDFHLRWQAHDADEETRNALSQPLTANRTLGALGGIVASRIAREFKLGGPCFTVSAGANSGLKSLEIGVEAIRSGEAELFVCGSVDMAGDIRQVVLDHAVAPSPVLTRAPGGMTPVSGPLTSEGAAAIVLKPLDRALQDNDRIYCVIRGMGSASAGETVWENASGHGDLVRGLTSSLVQSLSASGIHTADIGLYETHLVSGSHMETAEVEAFRNARSVSGMPQTNLMPVLGSASVTHGDTRCASGLIAFIKAAMSVYCGTYAPLPESLIAPNIRNAGFRLPQTLQPWQPPHPDAQRTACVAAIGTDGSCSHVIICQHGKGEGAVPDFPGDTPEQSDPDPADTIRLKPGREPVPDHVIHLLSPATVSGAAMETTLDESVLPEFMSATARAHSRFLDMTQETMAAMEKQFAALTDIASFYVHRASGVEPEASYSISQSSAVTQTGPDPVSKAGSVTFDREQCMAFATGKSSDVFGPEFSIIDTYPVRVRLPDTPLMLVDRILDIQGEMLSLEKGKIITQHDVKPDAWYLDGGKTPVCISIEAGQADLFLCSWLGIDHRVKGRRRYRLLDAKVTFHRTLPEPGDTLEYHIEIDRFLRQGDVYLFFFHYKGFIKNELFISMRDGCAGFFTPEEVEHSGGIILKKEDREPQPGDLFIPPVSCARMHFSDNAVDALRKGDLESAFGVAFSGKTLGQGLRLPGGRMRLVDRVVEFDPSGGRFGLGFIAAEADIHPDDWFLTCHFVDDMVMPGTLMYECCAHTLRIFTQRMGWISPRDDLYYDIIPGLESDLKCRGPVTQETRKAGYHIEIKAMGYNPHPFVIADAHMFSDNHRIVLYKDMGMTIPGMTRTDIESIWS